MTRLLVGHRKSRIICYRILLGYYSSVFNTALFDGFVETSKNEVVLPEDSEQDIRDLVT